MTFDNIFQLRQSKKNHQPVFQYSCLSLRTLSAVKTHFSARCSVLAAANPIDGNFDDSKDLVRALFDLGAAKNPWNMA